MKKCFLLFLLGAVCLVNGNAQNDAESTGIEIVTKLDKPSIPFNEDDLCGYLLVYFKDQDQSAYMAISNDGYTFTDINNGKPVFLGYELAEQKGVRDPHITRGPDGAFYLAMTDLHIFGQRAGYRDTEFERPAEKYGWGNNRALVLMKSYDLIHWTHSDFRVDKAFPELGDIDCSWAPETVYDPVEKKMMIYFTIRYNNRECHLYYSYPNDDFTKLETTPVRITDIGGLDGDARNRSYSPYSHFAVGAAFLTISGKSYIGANIENSSYPLCMCAERNAIYGAYLDGVKKEEIVALAIAADTDTPCSPCCACRQVISELLPKNAKILMANLKNEIKETTIAELLPFAFSEDDLK